MSLDRTPLSGVTWICGVCETEWESGDLDARESGDGAVILSCPNFECGQMDLGIVAPSALVPPDRTCQFCERTISSKPDLSWHGKDE